MNGEMQDGHTGSHEAHADLKVRPVGVKERSFSHGGELQLTSVGVLPSKHDGERATRKQRVYARV